MSGGWITGPAFISAAESASSTGSTGNTFFSTGMARALADAG